MAENDTQTPLEPDKSQEEIERLKAELDTKTKEMRNVVDELKEQRKLRQELETKLSPPKSVDDVDTKVKQALQEEKKNQAKVNKETAIKKFQEENNEFHPDNDPTGLKVAALQREFDGLKTDELFSVEEFISALSKARRLVSDEGLQTQTTIVPDASTPTTPPSPRARVESKLSSKEQQIIKEMSWTEERYLKVKQAQPRFVEKLLETK